MFDGKMKDFRSEGGIVKTDSEKREMAQKHRFKKEREFKKRITEETENEEDDIRSFKFHTNRFADFEKKTRGHPSWQQDTFGRTPQRRQR